MAAFNVGSVLDRVRPNNTQSGGIDNYLLWHPVLQDSFQHGCVDSLGNADESLPISSIATANGLCLAIFNLLQFIMLSAFSIVLNSGNPAAIVSAFAFLSFSCYLCTLFFWKFCPETTRLSIAEILRKFVPSWRLKQFYNSD